MIGGSRCDRLAIGAIASGHVALHVLLDPLVAWKAVPAALICDTSSTFKLLLMLKTLSV